MNQSANENLYPSTARDVQAIITAQLQQLWAQPERADKVAPLMLWGAPGVGKSTIVRDLCQRQNIDFIDIRLAQREPVDLRGLPVPKDDHVDWLLAGEWPRDPDSRGIILFDELSAADRTLQAAAYEIILDRRLGDLYRLPPGWLVLGAGNRMTDRAVAYSFSSALANRFCHLNLEPDVEQWCRWAQQQGLDPTVIGFLKFAPENFFNMEGSTEQGWPSPRSWERVAETIGQAERLGLNAQQQRIIVNGLIGAGAAAAFFAYRETAEELPDVGAMLRGEIPVRVPRTNDAVYALCAAVTHYLWRADKRDYHARLQVLFSISSKLSSDFATMLMLDSLRDYEHGGERLHEQRAERVFSHPGYTDWTAQHGMQFTAALESLV
ncbi:ATP-binding protein [Pseudidiomarina terrestris]|uniref:ATP-binding protein n=1 Tax=Pseudidiomarina terrestris TaxID=2820060 RepID=UPI0026534D8F|nr:AAA family ATPase [Pseudidiomarina sp. 1ASP75-5]MDN7135373.1 AAA family ATPase [Pseudidiomarina sp. 1ASP75-5]